MEALIKSAAVDGERFFVKTRFEKRWNTVCISRFSNRRIGGKDPSSAVGDLFRGSLENILNRRQLHLADVLDGKAQLRAAGKKIVAVLQHSVLAQSGEAL